MCCPVKAAASSPWVLSVNVKKPGLLECPAARRGRSPGTILVPRLPSIVPPNESCQYMNAARFFISGLVRASLKELLNQAVRSLVPEMHPDEDSFAFGETPNSINETG